MVNRVYHILILLFSLTTGISAQQSGITTTERPSTRLEMDSGAQVVTVSHYIWRGQRLTNDWSLQPSGTFSAGAFSVNIWGTLDLVGVNESDPLFINDNPDSLPGSQNGLQGKFSEVDYTFSYSVLVRDLNIDFGSIIYTFPERSNTLSSTVEIYGSIGLETLPMTPSATLYVDVDETRKRDDDAGLYLQLAGGHLFPTGHPRFPAIDLSGWVAFAGGGFGNYYYGVREAGMHDVNFTVRFPINLAEHAGVNIFLAYSALVGDFRAHQYRDARDLYTGTAGSPATYADTLWGGVNFSFGF